MWFSQNFIHENTILIKINFPPRNKFFIYIHGIRYVVYTVYIYGIYRIFKIKNGYSLSMRRTPRTFLTLVDGRWRVLCTVKRFVSMEQMLANMVEEGRGEELASFGNKVKEYWNTVKVEPPVRGKSEGIFWGVN